MSTAIEWTDTVWNPVTGCTKVSEGCRNCYAFELHEVRHRAYLKGKNLPRQYAKTFNEIQIFPNRLEQPLKWKKPRKIFVNSMSDLFHDQIPDEYLDQVFAVMLACATLDNFDHTFQVLTKRPERMQQYFTERTPSELVQAWAKAGDSWIHVGDGDMYFSEYVESLTSYEWNDDGTAKKGSEHIPFGSLTGIFPLPNVWLGTSVESPKEKWRMDVLRKVPTVVRFVSFEPLLDDVGEVDFEGIHWAIAGGESGVNARPMHPDWARDLRDQCQVAGVPFFFKQFGEWAPVHELRCNEPRIKGKPWYNFDPDTSVCRIGKKAAGRLLDGHEWNEFPKEV